MSKSNRRSSAVRKLDPKTMEVIPEAIQEMVGDAVVEVGESEGSGGTDQGKIVGDVNPIVSAGHSLDKLFKEHKNKSGVIRYLHAQGFATKHISKYLNIRYQHVRNVLNTPLKRQLGEAMPATQPVAE